MNPPTAPTPEAHLQAIDERLRPLDAALNRRVVSDALATATASRPFDSGAARQQATNLLRGGIEVDPATNAALAVDGRAATEYIAARLSSADFAHFIRSSIRHGGAALGNSSGAMTPGQAPVPPATEARTLGEQMIEHALAAAQQQTTTDPRADMGRVKIVNSSNPSAAGGRA